MFISISFLCGKYSISRFAFCYQISGYGSIIKTTGKIPKQSLVKILLNCHRNFPATPSSRAPFLSPKALYASTSPQKSPIGAALAFSIVKTKRQFSSHVYGIPGSNRLYKSSLPQRWAGRVAFWFSNYSFTKVFTGGKFCAILVL